MYNNYNRNRVSSGEHYDHSSQNFRPNPSSVLPPLIPPIGLSSHSGNYNDDSHGGGVQQSSSQNSWEYRGQRDMQGSSYSPEQGQPYSEENVYQEQSNIGRGREHSSRDIYSDRNYSPDQSNLDRNQPPKQDFLGRNNSQGQSYINRSQPLIQNIEKNQPQTQGYYDKIQPPFQAIHERNRSQGQGLLERRAQEPDIYDRNPRQRSYTERDCSPSQSYSGTNFSREKEQEYLNRDYSQGQIYAEKGYLQGQDYSDSYSQAPNYSEQEPSQEQSYSDSHYQGQTCVETNNDSQQNYQEQTYQDYNYSQDYNYNQDSSTRVQSNQEYNNSDYSNVHYSSSTYDPSETYAQSTVYAEEGGGGGGEVSVESNYENGTNNEYESPLQALEKKQQSLANEASYLPKNVLAKKTVNIFDRKTIPDNRRPPPINIDPNVPADIAALFKTNDCQFCNVKLNSRTQAQMHYEGRPHAKKLKSTLDKRFGRTSEDESSTVDASNAKKSRKDEGEASDSDSSKKKKSNSDGTQLYCKCCNLTFTSTDHATQHYLGRNHHRVLHGLKPLKTGYLSKETGQWQRNPTDPVTVTELLPVTKDGDGNTDTDLGKKRGSFFCKLCGLATTSSEQLEKHMTGVRHQQRVQQIRNKRKKPGSDSILASVIKPNASKKPKLFSKPKDFSIYRTPSGKFYCSPCDLTLNSETQFAQHVESKKHKIPKK